MVPLDRRTQVAAALASAGAAGVSGEAVAAALGISRVAVSKHVAALRALGYAIASAPRVGYRLESAPDVCIPEEVARRLRDALWVSCEGARELTSTNDEAKRLARAGAAEGTAVVCARQIGGRGRLGREWVSPEGGAYVSCVLRPKLPPSETAPLSLVVAVGAARGLAQLGVDAGLKWPNDLEAGGRKLGGILLEMAAEADRTEWVVAGIGVNVASPPIGRAATVREQAPNAAVADVAAAVLDGVAAAYRQFTESGFGSIRAEFESRSVLRGRRVTIGSADGATATQGVVAGIAEDGGLVLDSDGTRVHVAAGEVTVLG